MATQKETAFKRISTCLVALALLSAETGSAMMKSNDQIEGAESGSILNTKNKDINPLDLTRLITNIPKIKEDESVPPPAYLIIPEDPRSYEYRQEYTLSCEVASVKIALFRWGFDPSEDELLERLGNNSNPDLGFRGDPKALNPNGFENYGAHAPAVKELVENYPEKGIFQANYLYDLDQIRQALSENQPVLLWIPVGLYDYFPQPVILDDGSTAYLVPGEHVVVAYGFDDDGFFIHDPIPNEKNIAYAPNEELAEKMGFFEHPALALSPTS